MSSLMEEVRRTQESYYTRHKRYCARLDELPIRYLDGGAPHTLDEFLYKIEPDGQQYSLTWEGRFSRGIVVNHGRVTNRSKVGM